MGGFGKLYEQTFKGSMVRSGPVVFAVWGYVVAHLKPPGLVEINPAILATVIGCTEEEINRAMDVLTSPDPKSRSKEQEGRRLLKEGEFLYRAPTFEKYRKGDEDQRKASQNARQAKHRGKGKPKKKNGHIRPEHLPQPNPPRVVHEQDCQCGVCAGIRIEGALASPNDERDFV